MAKIDETKLIEQFQKAKKALDGFRKQERARQRREKAQADARRKTLIGEMVLQHVQTNPHEHDRLMSRLDSYLEAPKDRALFDLPPRPNASAPTPQIDPSTLTEPSRL